MILFSLFLALLLGILLSGFFSGIETGYYSVNKLRLSLKADENDRVAKRLVSHLSRPTWLLTVILIGNNLANNLATWLGQIFLGECLRVDQSATLLVVCNTLFLTPVLFVFGEVAPKALFRTRAENLTYSFSFGISLTGVILAPLVFLLRWPASLATKMVRGGGVFSALVGREGVKTILGKGTASLTKVQEDVAHTVMDLYQVVVGDVMRKLRVVSVVPADTLRADFLERASIRPHLRFPVHEAGKPSRIVGYVYLLDMLYDDRPECSVLEHLRPLDSFPASMPFDQALVLLQRSGQRMALVTGKEGAPQGIVTVRDLVERITGSAG